MQLNAKYTRLLFLLAFVLLWLSPIPSEAEQLPIINKGIGPDWIDSSNTTVGGALFGLAAQATGNRNGIAVDGYTNFGSGDIYYALYEDMQIRAFNLPQKMYLGGWPIGSASKLCPDTNTTCHAQWQALRWGTDEVLEDAVVKRFTNYGVSLAYDSGAKGPGCLRDHPLRYGDVTGDGKPELVLLLGDYYHTDFVVFSIDSKQLIFSAPLAIDDVTSQDDMNSDLTEMGKTAGPNDPQVWSSITFDNGPGINLVRPALRDYAKLYFGDFDSDGKPDILVWRKLYQSRLNSDTVKGFKLISQMYIHYAFIDGTYKKQSTDEATIKGWLAAKNLTWQQGYPNVSECPGEEGKPIPETVDPLLNDPDVLQ